LSLSFFDLSQWSYVLLSGVSPRLDITREIPAVRGKLRIWSSEERDLNR